MFIVTFLLVEFGSGTCTTFQASSLFRTATIAIGIEGQGQQSTYFGSPTIAAPHRQALFGLTNPTATRFRFSNP